VLKKTTSNGRGSTQTKKVGVVLKARESTRGACRPGSSTDTFSLQLQMVDDDGDVILDETRTGLTCDRRIGQQKFMATYEVENCAGSEAPGESSNGKANENSNGKANENSKGKANENSNGKADENSNGKSKRNSKGDVTVTATTEDGELIVSRALKCNK
jgi:hypothetical protein